MKRSAISYAILIVFLLSPNPARSQDVAPALPKPDGTQAKFAEQIRRVFGKFLTSDLEQVFQTADPIPCQELVGGGEWRPVSFVNDDPELSSWYRADLNQVDRDLRVFIFSGPCRSIRDEVLLTTKFPVAESLRAYYKHDIPLAEVDVNVNAPVSVTFNALSQTYAFDLPYMFLKGRANGERYYTLTPQTLEERAQYEPGVADHWDCKSVREDDVSFHFLICRATVGTLTGIRNGLTDAPYGSGGYLILSDGQEGSAGAKSRSGAPPR